MCDYLDLHLATNVTPDFLKYCIFLDQLVAFSILKNHTEYWLSGLL